MWRTDLIKNKLYSIGLILIGIVPVLIERDATALVFFLMIGIPLFFLLKRIGLHRRKLDAVIKINISKGDNKK